MEQSMAHCEQAARRAQTTYETAQQLVIRADKTMAWWVVLSALISALLVAIIFKWVL